MKYMHLLTSTGGVRTVFLEEGMTADRHIEKGDYVTPIGKTQRVTVVEKTSCLTRYIRIGEPGLILAGQVVSEPYRRGEDKLRVADVQWGIYLP